MSRIQHDTAAGAPTDLAGTAHWDAVWDRATTRRLPEWSYYTYRLNQIFQRHVRPGARLLEIGAGDSRWLPYFASRYGCDVWGVDYSATGVEAARRRLAGVAAPDQIVFGDVFAPQPTLEGRFDVVWSAGFIEHFDDVPRTVARLAEYLRPGGTMITLVPNVDGAIGRLHALADREVYDMHQHLDPAALDAAHAAAGLDVVAGARYLGVFSIGVVNFERRRRRLPRAVDRVLWGAVLGAQQLVCAPWRLLGVHPDSRALSPYVVGVYRLPA